MEKRVLKPNPLRIAIPKIFILIIASKIFLFLIGLNLTLIKITVPYYFYIILGSILLILVFVEAILAVEKSPKYEFEKEHLSSYGKENWVVNYHNITHIIVEKTTLDKLFGTASLIINHNFRIKDINKPQKILDYIEYLKKQQNL